MPVAKALGITDGDVSKLRAEIEKNVKREIARRLAARNKEAVMQVLIDANPLELPQSLVMMEISRLMHQAKQDLASAAWTSRACRTCRPTCSVTKLPVVWPWA